MKHRQRLPRRREVLRRIRRAKAEISRYFTQLRHWTSRRPGEPPDQIEADHFIDWAQAR
jgi:hypothetical protein